jgi:hypothetical protein
VTTALCIALIVAVAAAIAAPFLAAPAPVAAPRDQPRERLEREKTAALLAIREAELDHVMGKLSDEDHFALRAFYERRALTAIEALGGEPAQAASVERPAEACGACGSINRDGAGRCTQCAGELA